MAYSAVNPPPAKARANAGYVPLNADEAAERARADQRHEKRGVNLAEHIMLARAHEALRSYHDTVCFANFRTDKAATRRHNAVARAHERAAIERCYFVNTANSRAKADRLTALAWAATAAWAAEEATLTKT